MTEKRFDEELFKLVAQGTPYDQQKHEKMLQEVTMKYKVKTNKAKYLTWAYLAVCTSLILLGFQQFFRTDDIKKMIFIMTLIIIFHSGTVLMKLWWWTYSSRNAVLEELKTIRLQLAEMQSTDK